MIKPPNIKGVAIAGGTITLAQENDCVDPGKLGQYLRVEVVDGGKGRFLVLSTDRWALDFPDIDELCRWLKSLEGEGDGRRVEKSV